MRYILAIFLFIVFSPLSYSNEGEPASIAVILSRNTLPYKTALTGFRTVVSEKIPEHRILVFDLDGSLEEGHLILKKIKDQKPDVILTIGSIATEVAYNEAQAYPVVFTMVSNPLENGFIINNMTGVSLNVPPKYQFTEFKKVIPWMKKIGVIYNPGETKAIVAEAELAAKEMGLTIIPVAVASSGKVPEALKSLRGRIDVLWSVTDSAVFDSKSISYMITYTQRNKIPFMGISSYFVQEGALVATSPDYMEVGRQSGEMVLKILSGELPSQIPIGRPKKMLTSINLKTAWDIGINPSSKVLSDADEVIK